MNTLTAIEAERVNQILLHALERLEVLSYLPISWDDDISKKYIFFFYL